MKKVLNDDGVHSAGLGVAPVGLGDNSAGLRVLERLAAILKGLIAAAPPLCTIPINQVDA